MGSAAPELGSEPGFDFSIAICTYNGEKRLPDVLECLLQQVHVENLAWEVIVVDNNSTDGTAAVVEDYRARWPQQVPLRYAFEAQQGAGYARHHAVAISQSPLIGFLDDDNLPAPDWIQQAADFAQHHPQAGAFGSRIRGLFEGTPPPHFERIAAFLALTDRGSEPLLYKPSQKILPPSAGLVVRRQAWLDHVPTQMVLSGRTGQSMLTGEDLESILHIQRAGWQIWYNPEMQLEHKIPCGRLERSYLIRFFRGIGLSRYRTRSLGFPAWCRPLVLPLYTLNDVRKIGRQLLKYRRGAFTDTVAACEMTLYCYSLISPLYLWQRRFRREVSQPKA
ncbi:MAG TPA: hormogonium polysaccharide biosynthesis glycosyltransferase HpsE [Trichocoleus sp.]